MIFPRPMRMEVIEQKSKKPYGLAIQWNEPLATIPSMLSTYFRMLPTNPKMDVVFDLDLTLSKEAYVIDWTNDKFHIGYSHYSGAFYACQALIQAAAEGLRFHRIEDEPQLGLRGVMIDISRDKIPTMSEFRRILQELSWMRINHVEFYVEGFSFLVDGIDAPWETPLTLDEFLSLQKEAKLRAIDLVPNMNGLGHMSKWLALDSYRHFAEKEDGFVQWGYPFPPSTINPLDTEAVEFVKTLLLDLATQSQSTWFHLNLDEPFELGQGKSKEVCESIGVGQVYLDHLRKLCTMLETHQKRPMVWGDVLLRHPETWSQFPKNVVICDWGYDHDYPFEQHAKSFKEHQIPFITSPGTSSWNSLTSRVRDMEATTLNATKSAIQFGGIGVLTTDWGDFGHLQYPIFSTLGFATCAQLTWMGSHDPSEIDAFLDHWIQRPGFSDIMRILGSISTLEDDFIYNSSKVFHPIMFSDPDPSHDVLFKRHVLLQALGKPLSEKAKYRIKQALSDAEAKVSSQSGTAKLEIKNTILLVQICLDAMNGLFGYPWDKTRWIEQIEGYERVHEELWHQRNRHGGYSDSISRIHALKAIISSL